MQTAEQGNYHRDLDAEVKDISTATLNQNTVFIGCIDLTNRQIFRLMSSCSRPAPQ